MLSRSELKRMGLKAIGVTLYLKQEELKILEGFALERGFVRERVLEGADPKVKWTTKDTRDAAKDAINWMVREEITKAQALENVR